LSLDSHTFEIRLYLTDSLYVFPRFWHADCLAILTLQIFRLPKTTLKALLHLGQSKSPIVSSTLFPALSGRPAIFQLFLALATSPPHFGHLAMHLPPTMINHHGLNDIE
jgi:hypothetical protein